MAREGDRASGAAPVRAAVATAIRLALGAPKPDDRVADWPLVLGVTRRELLAPLAWTRSRPFIRDHADTETVMAWRRAAVAADLHGERQLDALRGTLAGFTGRRVDAVVLKGMPLGARLYGDPFVRCSTDIDLYVPAASRGAAADALRALGWFREDGVAPWHEAWARRKGGDTEHLELHSSLVSDHLTHLPVPPLTIAYRDVGGLSVPALDGPFLPSYLAAHLATHQMPPILWDVDFATLWTSLSDDDRLAAMRAAAATRLSAYLAWARGRAAALLAVASGDTARLDALGFARQGRRDVHSIVRHLTFAASASDRARLIGAFVVPRRTRGNLRELLHYTAARLRTRVRSLVSVWRSYVAGSAMGGSHVRHAEGGFGRPLRVERDELVSLVREVAREGGALRVRAPGGSMLPSIPRGALVRIGGVPDGGIAPGDVVLALTADGEPILHRVVEIDGAVLRLRGDAALTDDRPVPLSRVIGLATHVAYEGVERELSRRVPRSLSVAAMKLRRRFARVVRRVR